MSESRQVLKRSVSHFVAAKASNGNMEKKEEALNLLMAEAQKFLGSGGSVEELSEICSGEG